MKCSIVMATYNRAPLLAAVLESIRSQKVPFEYELIVVDDGSTDDTKGACESFGADRYYLHRPGYCNPAAARNVGYRAATGDIIIAQSSDTGHVSDDAIVRLCDLAPRTFNIARVDNQNEDGTFGREYTGERNQRPLFFLGSLLRKDLYAIGGDDETFTVMGCEDDWFADRLIHGRGLKPVYREDVRGVHMWHPRPKTDWDDQFPVALLTLSEKRKAAQQTGEWVASGGAW